MGCPVTGRLFSSNRCRWLALNLSKYIEQKPPCPGNRNQRGIGVCCWLERELPSYLCRRAQCQTKPGWTDILGQSSPGAHSLRCRRIHTRPRNYRRHWSTSCSRSPGRGLGAFTMYDYVELNLAQHPFSRSTNTRRLNVEGRFSFKYGR